MYLAIALDLLAITLLTYGLYFRRHRRRDLVVAFLGINLGVLGVCLVLTSSAVSAGLGLGLFGVLSIIRLRSTEIAQHEVAYYFGALALGLIAGLGGLSVVTVVATTLVLAALAIGDQPRLLGAHRSQLVRLDVAIAREAELLARLEGLLDAKVEQIDVKQLDLVNDSTLVEVRYVAGRRPIAPAAASDLVDRPIDDSRQPVEVVAR